MNFNNNFHLLETNLFDRTEHQRKKSCGIWSLAEMAEKNDKIHDFSINTNDEVRLRKIDHQTNVELNRLFPISTSISTCLSSIDLIKQGLFAFFI